MTELEYLLAMNAAVAEWRAERAGDKIDRAVEELCALLGSEERHERLDFRADLIETKFSGGTADGSFTGYASVFNEPHESSSPMLGYNWKDQIAPGAFSQSLSDHKARGTMPALLWMHDAAAPVGVWARLQETDRGLRAEGRLVTSTQKGAETYELVKAGAVTGLSIGFTTKKYELAEKEKLRTIREVSLHEVSLVSMPGDPLARVNRD